MEPKKKPAARKAAPKRAAKPKATAGSVAHRHHTKQPSLSAADLAAVSATSPATSDSVVMPQPDAPGAVGSHGAGRREPIGRHNWMVIGGTVVGLLVIFLVVFGILIYKYNSDSRLVQFVADIVPYPAETVNGHLVRYSDFLFEVNSNKHFSQSSANGSKPVDYTTAAGKEQLKNLQRQELVELQKRAIVAQLASKYNISVSSQDIQQQVDQFSKSSGGESKLKNVLATYYGWNEGDLKRELKYQLLQQKVTTKVQSDPGLNAQAKDKANMVLSKLQNGGDFAALAKQYSQDSSAANGGDLGFFTKSQVPSDLANAIFALQPGQTTGVIKTQYGYGIAKVTAFNADHSQVHASLILIKSVDFNQYLQEQLKSATVHQYIHIS